MLFVSFPCMHANLSRNFHDARRCHLQAPVPAASIKVATPAAAATAAATVATPAAAATSAASASASSTDPAVDIEMETGPAPTAATAATAPKAGRPSSAAAMEVEVYLLVLALSMLSAAGAWPELAVGADRVIEYAARANRRTLDAFTARCYTYLALAREHVAAAGGASGEDEAALRPKLLAAHRTAVLRHDEIGAATLLNLLLRSLIRARDYSAASKLLARAPFPEAASPAQLTRYLYYKGRIVAVARLDYSAALATLQQSARKAPSHGTGAAGLRLAAARCTAVVSLLTGEVPERALFFPLADIVTAAPAAAAAPSSSATASASATAIAPRTVDPRARAALAPYFTLTRAVRAGDVSSFRAVLAAHAAPGAVFDVDGTASLVRRLEANVIKTGLRALATAYSRLSFASVASKLGLGSAEDAEFLCAKVRSAVVVLRALAGTQDCACTASHSAVH